jgi:hypothetical protein
VPIAQPPQTLFINVIITLLRTVFGLAAAPITEPHLEICKLWVVLAPPWAILGRAAVQFAELHFDVCAVCIVVPRAPTILLNTPVQLAIDASLNIRIHHFFAAFVSAFVFQAAHRSLSIPTIWMGTILFPEAYDTDFFI